MCQNTDPFQTWFTVDHGSDGYTLVHHTNPSPIPAFILALINRGPWVQRLYVVSYQPSQSYPRSHSHSRSHSRFLSHSPSHVGTAGAGLSVLFFYIPSSWSIADATMFIFLPKHYVLKLESPIHRNHLAKRD